MKKRLWLWMVVFVALLMAPALAKDKDKRVYQVTGSVYADLPRRPSDPPGGVAGVPKCTVTLTCTGTVDKNGKTDTTSPNGQTYTVTTTGTGTFDFLQVPPGNYTVTASRPGVGSATKTMIVGGFNLINAVTLKLAPDSTTAVMADLPAAPPQGAPAGSYSSSSSGHAYVALAPLVASLQQQQQAHNNSDHSFGGKNIPGPPTWNEGYKAILMYNGGDPNLMVTGRPRRDPMKVYDEGRNAMPITTDTHAMMRMSVGNNRDVQYARQEGNPYWVTLDAQGTHLYVSTDQNAVDIYDTSSMAKVGHITVGGAITDLTRSTDGNWIFAPIAAGNPGVVVIDPRKMTAVRFIPTPTMSNGEQATPTSVASNGDSTRIYVTLSNPRNGEVALIDTLSKKVLRRIKVGAQPLGSAITPDGRLLFVANNSSASVSVINAQTLTEITRVHTGIAPVRVAVLPDGTKAYVTCKGSNVVSVISGTGTVAASIPVEAGPTGIAVSADGRKAFVANTNAGTISTIATDRDVVENTTIDEPDSRPFGVAIGP